MNARMYTEDINSSSNAYFVFIISTLLQNPHHHRFVTHLHHWFQTAGKEHAPTVTPSAAAHALGCRDGRGHHILGHRHALAQI